MSDLVVKICSVDSVKPHPNADALDLAIIKGWQTVVRKGEWKAGDQIVFFPPDTILSKTWTEKFGVTKFCSEKPEGMRIRQVRLRGEPSFGLVVRPEPEIADQPLGTDVADFYSAKKYEPPVLGKAGDILGNNHPLFEKFTEIENLRNFTDVLIDGEEVDITEKLDGTQVRIGRVSIGSPEDPVWMAGSKEWPRKQPETDDEMKSNFYWFPYTLEPVRKMLDSLVSIGTQINEPISIILYGETFGKVQKLRYGLKGLAFRAFALRVNGQYLGRDEFERICNYYGVEMVPLVYRGPYSFDKIKELSEGKSLIPTADHIREGVVVKPVVERTDPRVGRVILKYLSDNYLLSKFHDIDTTDV